MRKGFQLPVPCFPEDQLPCPHLCYLASRPFLSQPCAPAACTLLPPRWPQEAPSPKSRHLSQGPRAHQVMERDGSLLVAIRSEKGPFKSKHPLDISQKFMSYLYLLKAQWCCLGV